MPGLFGDAVVLLVLGVVIAFCLRSIWKNHKAGGCGGNCAGCSGCSCGSVPQDPVDPKE